METRHDYFMSKKQQEDLIDVLPLLTRLDERTKNIESKITTINRNIKSDYVSADEFKPVKSVVYGMVSIFMVAIVGSIFTLILK